MASPRENLESESLGQLADRMQYGPSAGYHPAAAELERRKADWQREVAADQKRAAEATIQTAEYTRLNARYVLWSVVALVLTSLANLVVVIFHVSR